MESNEIYDHEKVTEAIGAVIDLLNEMGCNLLEASRVCISVAYAACMDINGRIAQMDSEDAE